MAEFTKEELIERAQHYARLASDAMKHVMHPVIRKSCEMDLRLAEIALAALTAGMEQGPVACIDRANIDYLESGAGADVWPASEADSDDVLLYAAPQLPQPVVVPSSELLSAMEEVLRISDRDHDAWHRAREGIADFRAAMLQGAEPVTTLKPVIFIDGNISPDDADKLAETIRKLNSEPQQMIAEPVSQPYTLRDGLAAIRSLGGIDAEKIQAERDALNAPVQGWIPCSERMPLTPEEGCEYWDVEVQAFDGERVLIAHYAIGSKPKPWGAWVDTHAEITHWQPLAAPPLPEVN